MKPKFEIDGGKILLAGAALVQGAQYAQAFSLVHHDLAWAALAGGALAGGVVVGAIAYAGNNLPRLKSKQAKQWGTVIFVGMLMLSPLALTPVNWYTMDHNLRQAIDWYAWLLAGLIASLPELALGLVALVDRSLITTQVTERDVEQRSVNLGETQSNAGATQVQRKKKAGQRKATQTTYTCVCGYSVANRFAFAGHKRTCRKEVEQ